MNFSKPPTESRKGINRAGKILADPNSSVKNKSDALEIVNSFRAAHAYPINTFQATLRSKLRTFEEALVAQRLKRMPTIIDKLRRYPDMQVTTMQDIGGVRAVLKDMRDVELLANQYRDRSRFKHEIKNEMNHIANPRSSDGYRSLHLIYKYRNERAPEYEGLLVELQIRTRLQHAWATAVETMGTFTGQALKSRQGDEKWLRFFALTSSAFSYIERTQPVFPDKTLQQTCDELRSMEETLGVINQLSGLAIAPKVIDDSQQKNPSKYYYHLIILDSSSKSVTIKSYSRNELEKATADYLKYEKRAREGELIEPVLVSAGNIDQLKKAYPNYFLDAHYFLQNLERILRTN